MTLTKSIDLESTNKIVGQENDYRLYGNRDYINAYCGWVKLWVDWSDVQSWGRGSSDIGTLYGQLGSNWNWSILDGQIRQANLDGVYVILQFEPHIPTWDRPAAPEPGTGKDPMFHFPSDITVGSPWERFVSYCYNRYRPGATINPLGAYINAIEPFNEPNYLQWPQSTPNAGPTSACTVAQAAQSLENAFVFWGPHAGMLIPGAADVPEKSVTDPVTGAKVLDWTKYSDFAYDVLELLKNWRPRFYVDWSQHNYRDIKYGKVDETNGASLAHYRAYTTVRSLWDNNWRGGGNRNLWLTEGGYVLPDSTDQSKADQANRLLTTYGAMTGIPEVVLFSQHLIFDSGPGKFRSGFRAFDSTTATPGPTYPAWTTFATM